MFLCVVVVLGRGHPKPLGFGSQFRGETFENNCSQYSDDKTFCFAQSVVGVMSVVVVVPCRRSLSFVVCRFLLLHLVPEEAVRRLFASVPNPSQTPLISSFKEPRDGCSLERKFRGAWKVRKLTVAATRLTADGSFVGFVSRTMTASRSHRRCSCFSFRRHACCLFFA